MKRFYFIFALILFGTSVSNAQSIQINTLDLELHPVTEEGLQYGSYMPLWLVSADTPAGQVGFFGFYEARLGLGNLLNTQTSWFPSSKVPLGLATEQGYSKAGTHFLPGARFVFSDQTVVGRVAGNGFNFVAATYLNGTLTDTKSYTHEFIVSWATKPVSMGPVSVHSDGFYRIRTDAPNFGQPQVWFTHKSLPFKLGAEFELVGREVLTLFGVRWSLK